MKNLYTVSYLALVLVTANNINAAGAGGLPPYEPASTYLPPYATATAATSAAAGYLPPYATATAAATAGAGAGTDFTPPYTEAASAHLPLYAAPTAGGLPPYATAHTHIPPYAAPTAGASVTEVDFTPPYIEAAAGAGGDFTPPYTEAAAGAGASLRSTPGEEPPVIGYTKDFMPVYRGDNLTLIDRSVTTYYHLQAQWNAYRKSLTNPAAHAASGELPFYAQLQALISTSSAGDASVTAAAGAGTTSFSPALTAAIADISADIDSDPTPVDETSMPAIASAATAGTGGGAEAGTTSAAAYAATFSRLPAPQTPSVVGASVTASAAAAPMEDVRIEAPAETEDLSERRDFLSMIMMNDVLIRGAYLTADVRGIDDTVLCSLTLRDSKTALNVLHQLQFIAGAKGFKIINPDDTWYGDLAGYFTNMMIRAYYNPNHVTFLKEAIRVARIEPILDPKDATMVTRLDDALKSWERDHPTG